MLLSSYLAFTCLYGLFAVVGGTPAPVTLVLHERRSDHGGPWVKKAKPHKHINIPMRIGLQQSNVNHGHDLLMDMANHDSPNYAKWFSAEEVHEIFAPATTTVERVREWLHAAGIAAERVTQSTNKQWLQFDASVEEAETLLYADYHLFEHTPSGKISVACDEYHIPSHLQEHIDYVMPGIALGGLIRSDLRKSQSAHTDEEAGDFDDPSATLTLDKRLVHDDTGTLAATAGSATISLTPSDIRSFYKIPLATSAQAGNELGIYESGEWYDPKDLEKYFSLYAPEIPKNTIPITEGIDGGKLIIPAADQTGEGEDSQIAYPIVYPQKIINYQVNDLYYESFKGEGFLGHFNTFLDAIDGSYCTFEAYGIKGDSPGIDPTYPDPHPNGYNHSLQCGVYKPTNVISFSFGGNETSLPTKYQERQCLEFMKLGMQGVTTVFASGDEGATGRYGPKCAGPNHDKFTPYAPTNCPYVLAVGGTMLDGNRQNFTETAAPFSGGGFSNVFSTPHYQNASVQAYLDKNLNSFQSYCKVSANSSEGGTYNRCGRGTPDVSAIGYNILTILKGKINPGGGTSGSAPLFAAVLNRINEERIANGKKTIGFVNPTFYAHPEIFNDIVKGGQAGCDITTNSGFAVSKDWDPVTGLGSPNYPAMLDLFMKLP